MLLEQAHTVAREIIEDALEEAKGSNWFTFFHIVQQEVIGRFRVIVDRHDVWDAVLGICELEREELESSLMGGVR